MRFCRSQILSRNERGQMHKYSDGLVKKFQELYKGKFNKQLKYEVAERELYELAHLIKKIYQ